jgi:hypothetical protein
MSMNLDYSNMENEKLIANYILQSGEYGLRTRSNITKGLRNELKNRTIINYDSLITDKIEKYIETSILSTYKLNDPNQHIIKSNLEDLLRFLPEDAKEGGNLLDIVAPSQNNI